MLPKNSDIRFEVSTLCQYKCVFCMNGNLKRSRQTMGMALFKTLIDKILAETSQYKSVSFAGIGEPLLDYGLYEKVKYATEKGFETRLVTNGALLKPDLFKAFEHYGLISVRVSFHGGTREAYKALHGIDNFDLVKEYLEEISKIRKTTKLFLTFASVEGVNADTVEDWIRLWDGKADLVEAWRAHNWVDLFQFRDVQTKKRATCGRVLNGPLQIQVNGTITTCCFDYNGKLEFGDLKTQTLKEIFTSEKYLHLVERHTSGDFVESGFICETCDQRNEKNEEAIIYSSGFDIKDRVNLISTSFDRLDNKASLPKAL